MRTDAELMQEFQAGKAEAFEALVMRHHVGVFNFFARMHGDREEAEDQTQEVFCRLFRKAKDYRPEAKFTTYIFRIARNCWIDWVRKRSRRGRQDSLDLENDEGNKLLDRLPAEGETPLEQLAAKETGDQIGQALACLSEGMRLVFIMAEVENMRYAEIAEILEIPEGTVKSRMHGAVQELRRHLAKLAPEDADI